MAQLAIGWVLCNDNVASAIVGASRPEQVKDNAAAKRLEPDLKQAVDDALAAVVMTDPGLTQSPPKRP
jgi:aryl-alcohol dehydrogenase-like predicted oxidoreductase